jgi:hypothetical protein
MLLQLLSLFAATHRIGCTWMLGKVRILLEMGYREQDDGLEAYPTHSTRCRSLRADHCFSPR